MLPGPDVMMQRVPGLLAMTEARRLLAGASRYVKTATVHAHQLAETTEWVTRRGDQMSARAGDWLIQDGDERWTVAQAIFADRYREVEPGVFRSRQEVRAQRLEEPVDVETLEGRVSAAEGDVLVLGPDGDVWPVSQARFAATYRPTDPAGRTRT